MTRAFPRRASIRLAWRGNACPRGGGDCGQLGKQDNCQTAVSLSVANRHGSVPIAYRLYLPKERTGDEERRRRAGVPGDVTFLTKPEIALEQIAKAHQDGVPRGVVLMDAGYGVNTGASAMA